MAREAVPKPFAGSLYFAYTGAAIAAVLLVTSIGGFLRHTWDEELLRAVIAVLATTVAYAATALRGKLRYFPGLTRVSKLEAIEGAEKGASRFYEGLAWAMSAVFVVTAVVLVYEAHRRYTFAVGLFEASAIFALRKPLSSRALVAIAIVSGTTWALSSGLTYTHFGDWMLNSNASPFAPLRIRYEFWSRSSRTL